MTDFEIVVPFRGGNPLREKALDEVLVHLQALEAVLWVSDAPELEPFSPGAARNRGAANVRAEVIVFNDADTLAERRATLAAVRLAALEPGLVYAYTIYYRRDRFGNTERELWNPPSLGCAAISRESFLELGGFDERYRGWGYEDCAFATAAGERYGAPRRVEAAAFHLWHGGRRRDDSPEDSDAELVAANLQRWTALAASTS